MLHLLRDLSYGVNQAFADGSKVNRLTGDIEEKKISIDQLHSGILVLYERLNFSGRNEAGIFEAPGPACEDWDCFRMKMIRFFSRDEKCWEVASSYYDKLVEEYDLIPIELARTISI